MKQITKLFALFLLTAGFVLTSCTNDDNPVVTPPDSGDEPEPEVDIKWTYTVLDENAKTCMLGKSATDAPATTAIDESITGSVTIPESIDGYKVVEINKSAFKGCQISSIIVPNTVTKIGDEAFKRCHSLTTLELGSGVTSVGEDALQQCENLTDVTIFATMIQSILKILHLMPSCMCPLAARLLMLLLADGRTSASAKVSTKMLSQINPI